MDNNSLINLKDKRIEYLRKVYEYGENDNLLPIDIINIMEARKELLFNIGLIDYNDKIIFITKELDKKRHINENYNIIYYVFTKCFDFILSHDNMSILKEKFIHYINLLYNYLLKNKFDFTKVEMKSNMLNSIKLLTFDIQTIMINSYIKEDAN